MTSIYRIHSTLYGKCAATMPSPSTSPFLQALRRAAPSLSRQLFPQQRCLRLSARANLYPRTFSGLPSRPKKQIGPAVERIRRLHTVTASETFLPAAGKVSAASRFPDTSSNAVAYWLLGSAASVFGIVVFGGLTRLTESGHAPNRSFIKESVADSLM